MEGVVYMMAATDAPMAVHSKKYPPTFVDIKALCTVVPPAGAAALREEDRLVRGHMHGAHHVLVVCVRQLARDRVVEGRIEGVLMSTRTQ